MSNILVRERYKRRERARAVIRESEIIAKFAGLLLPLVCLIGRAQRRDRFGICALQVIFERSRGSLPSYAAAGNLTSVTDVYFILTCFLSVPREYVHSRFRARVCTQNARCFYLLSAPRRVAQGENLREREYQRLTARDIPSARYFSARDKRAERDCHCCVSKGASCKFNHP